MPLSVPSSPWFAVAIGLAALLVLQTLVAWARRRMRRDRIVARVLVAALGEHDATELLRELGYEILGAQVSAAYPVLVDGAEKQIGIRADFLVARSQRRFIVEVKTGAVAPRIETAATRRQLLEYLVAFEVDGVLLLDMQERVVRAVEFPQLGALFGRADRDEANASTANGASWLGWLGWLVGAGAIAAFVHSFAR